MTIEEIKKDILSKMAKGVENATNYASSLMDSVLSGWYSSYSPSSYHRTGKILGIIMPPEIRYGSNIVESMSGYTPSGLSYSTGKASGGQVFAATMEGGHGAEGLLIASYTIPVWDTVEGNLNFVVIDMILAALG